MADRPILFSGPMVHALLEGRKTQTRRVLKPQPDAGQFFGSMTVVERKVIARTACGLRQDIKLPAEVGDRLWVRERWGRDEQTGEIWHYALPGGHTADHVSYDVKWKPSIHMPKTASRMTLIVTDVRVERVQDISQSDPVYEGIEQMSRQNWHYARRWRDYSGQEAYLEDHRESFRTLWDSINGKREGCAWSDNPWVVALTFDVHQSNIDALPAPSVDRGR